MTNYFTLARVRENYILFFQLINERRFALGVFEFIGYCFKCVMGVIACTTGHVPDWFGYKDGIIGIGTIVTIFMVFVLIKIIIYLIQKHNSNR